MRDFTTPFNCPVPVQSCSGLTSRIRKAIIQIDETFDPQDREKAIANAVIAASNVWLQNECSCSQCWNEYRESIRLLVS